MKSLTLIACIASALPAAAQIADLVSLRTNQVPADNAAVRIAKWTIRPGAEDGRHPHPSGWTVVTKAGALTIANAAGMTVHLTPKAGEQAWAETEGALTAQNTAKTTLEYIDVKIKGAAAKPQDALRLVRRAGDPTATRYGKLSGQQSSGVNA